MDKKRVLCGIDRIESELPQDGMRLGLITNPTGVDREFRPTVDILREKYKLICMLSPEHGVRGDLQAGDKVESYIDAKTGLPVYSLYGESCHIKPEVMQSIDAVVFDIQDVGARFYTYLYTLSYAMEDCAKAGKRVIVLDRPNAISCKKSEGTILKLEFASFVGRFPIATRINMTMGEYARFINREQGINCDLQVIGMEGYSRELYYDDTDLAWIAPSPNLPTVQSCISYIGTCHFEGTNLSEGRGTTRPFEQVGAPWLKAAEVIEELSRYKLSGVKLRETYFNPTFSKHCGELCAGVSIHITDRDSFEPFRLGILLLDTIRRLHSEFEFLPPLKEGARPPIDILLGTDEIRKSDFNAKEFLATAALERKEYDIACEKYRLYK